MKDLVMHPPPRRRPHHRASLAITASISIFLTRAAKKGFDKNVGGM
jgi:hypothetical protein